ncbi:MAG: hypothetical protein HYT22_01830 [Candidatus Niyogibacteria bacterium]|nr:hypothetical protein [Candidatus Niyogibacteria bacterium]
MPIFSWKAKRQLVVFGALILAGAAVIAYLAFLAVPEATCFDNRQNQGEEGVDCGGPCTPCLANLSEPVVLWSRFFQLGEGLYEAAAFIENIHNFAAADRAFYRVKLYDANNILISQRAGETYINPAERFLILEPGLFTGERKPVRVSIEFEPTRWRYADYAKPNILVVRRDFTLTPSPRLSVTIRNAGSADRANLQASAILLDAAGNAYGASQTAVEELRAGAERVLSFSWPTGAVTTEPSAIDVLVRTPAPR